MQVGKAVTGVRTGVRGEPNNKDYAYYNAVLMVKN